MHRKKKVNDLIVLLAQAKVYISRNAEIVAALRGGPDGNNRLESWSKLCGMHAD